MTGDGEMFILTKPRRLYKVTNELWKWKLKHLKGIFKSKLQSCLVKVGHWQLRKVAKLMTNGWKIENMIFVVDPLCRRCGTSNAACEHGQQEAGHFYNQASILRWTMP